MKILAVAVISLAFSCLLPFSLGQVDRYKMSSVEKGTPFTEEIEVDEKQDVEVFRVPAHNDVDAADYYHDFKMRVTVTKVLSRKVCYIANMDPSMPSPKKLKADLARPDKLPITKQEHLVVVTGPANRLLLTKEILDFCGTLPMYKTEIFYNPIKDENGTLVVRATRRQRRQTSFVVTEFVSCIAMETKGKGDVLQNIKAGGCLSSLHWDLECQFHISCPNTKKVWPYRDQDWLCTTSHHNLHCCDYKCSPGTGK